MNSKSEQLRQEYVWNRIKENNVNVGVVAGPDSPGIQFWSASNDDLVLLYLGATFNIGTGQVEAERAKVQQLHDGIVAAKNIDRWNVEQAENLEWCIDWLAGILDGDYDTPVRWKD